MHRPLTSRLAIIAVIGVTVVATVATVATSGTAPAQIVVIRQTADGFDTDIVTVPAGADPTAYAKEAAGRGDTLAAGTPATRHALTVDGSAQQQWGYVRVGGDRIRSAGNGQGIVVAVLDTGVDADHPELRGRVRPGWDPIAGTDATSDPNGHGTHVAGIIAAAADNLGTTGAAPGVEILPVRVLGADGNGDDTHLAQGILWAVDNGADVINMSLGGAEPSDLLESSITTAVGRGVTVIAAAGNDALTGNRASYPAAYRPVLAVGATDPGDRRALYSNTGTYVDIAAPGTAIWSTWPGGRYTYNSGTSMAAPFVAAAAAVAGAATGVRGAALADLLVSTALDVGEPGHDTETGAGVVDVLHATGHGTIEPAGTNPRLPDLPKLPELSVPTFPPLPTLTLAPGVPRQPATPTLPASTLPKVTVPPPPTVNPVTTTPGAPKSTSAVLIRISGSGTTRRVTITLRVAGAAAAGRTLTVTTPSGSALMRTDSAGTIRLYTRYRPGGQITARFAGDPTTRPSGAARPM